MFWKDNIHKNCDYNGTVLKTVAVDDYNRYLGSADTSDGMA